MKRFHLLLYFALSAWAISPIQLVAPTDNHEQLLIVEEGLEALKSIKSPISIVGIVGPYHSGKSFLMNAFLGEKDGFAVGPTIKPKTMGIWVLPTNIRASDNSTIVLMDTEGFFGSDVAEAYDAKIFALTTLLSSHLVYSSIKLIDQSAVDYLELLARRTQLFQLKNAALNNLSEEQLDVPSFLKGEDFPDFTWVVKDFIQDLDGASPQSWLEEYLDGNRDSGIEGMDGTLKDIFKSVNCHTMFIPSTNKNDLRDLSKLSAEDFTEDFASDLQALKTSVIQNLGSKRMSDGRKMNGSSFAMMLQFLVQSSNQDIFPSVPSLWNSWIQSLVETAYRDANSNYKNKMEKLLSLGAPPSEEEFLSHHNTYRDDSQHLYRNLLFDFQSLYQDGIPNLMKEISEKFSNFEERNKEKIRKVIADKRREVRENFAALMDELHLPTAPKNIINKFRSSNGLDVFEDALKKYGSSKYYIEALSDLKGEVEGIRDKVILKNLDRIKNKLGEVSDVMSRKYEDIMNKLTLVAMAPVKLVKSAEEAVISAKSHASEYLKNQSHSWIEELEEFSAHIALVEKKFVAKLKEFEKKNEEKIGQKAEALVKDISSTLKSGFSAILPFPDEEETLVAKAGNEIKIQLEKFTKGMHDLVDSERYKFALSELKKLTSGMVEDLKERNVRDYKSKCFDVLKCAEKILDRDESVFSLAYYLPFALKSKATSAVKDCFSKSTEFQKFSEKLKTKVINDWYKTDLAAKSVAVEWRMILIGALLLMMTVAGFLFYYQAKPQTRKSHLKTKVQ